MKQLSAVPVVLLLCACSGGKPTTLWFLARTPFGDVAVELNAPSEAAGSQILHLIAGVKDVERVEGDEGKPDFWVVVDETPQELAYVVARRRGDADEVAAAAPVSRAQRWKGVDPTPQVLRATGPSGPLTAWAYPALPGGPHSVDELVDFLNGVRQVERLATPPPAADINGWVDVYPNGYRVKVLKPRSR